MSWILRSKQFGLGDNHIVTPVTRLAILRSSGMYFRGKLSSTTKQYGAAVRQTTDDPCPGRLGRDLRGVAPAWTVEPAAALDRCLGPDLHSFLRAGVRNAGPSFDFRSH